MLTLFRWQGSRRRKSVRDMQRLTQSDLTLAIQLRERDMEQAKSGHRSARNALVLELQAVREQLEQVNALLDEERA